MKEVLTKSFWRGVKKTFYEALEDSPPQESASQTAAESNLNSSSKSESPSPPSSSSEQQ